MAVEIPNLTEALGRFVVDPIGLTVTLVDGAGFLPTGIYNGPGDYSVFLIEEKGNKLMLGASEDAGFSVSLNAEANLAEVRVRASAGGAAPSGGSVIMFGASELANFADTRFLYPYFLQNFADGTIWNIVIPADGVIRGLHVLNRTVGGTGATINYTVMVNGLATAVVLAAISSDAQSDETVLSVAVSEGDLLGIRAVKPLDIAPGPLNIIVTTSFEADSVVVPTDVTNFSVEVENIPINA